jgi:hypothetical protein
MSTQCKKFHFYLNKFVAIHFEFFFNSNYISYGHFLIILTRSMNLCCYRNLTSANLFKIIKKITITNVIRRDYFLNYICQISKAKSEWYYCRQKKVGHQRHCLDF